MSLGERAVAAVASVARMRTKGCLRIMSRPSTVSRIEASTTLELGAGGRRSGRTRSPFLADSMSTTVAWFRDPVTAAAPHRRSKTCPAPGRRHKARRPSAAREVRPVITVPVSQAKLSSRPCGISPSVDCTVRAGASSKPLDPQKHGCPIARGSPRRLV